jgi:peroxiredoxin
MRLAAALLALAGTAFAIPPVPRKSPEFTIVQPSGQQILLSSLKGKVVVFTFMETTCPHCQAESQLITKLVKDLGPRGFEAVGVAFDQGVNGPMVANFVHQFNVGYRVGFSAEEPVVRYLGLSVMDRYVVPQVVVIDKNGMIRAQTEPLGNESPSLKSEPALRSLIESLLKEGGPVTSNSAAKKTTAAAKKTN